VTDAYSAEIARAVGAARRDAADPQFRARMTARIAKGRTEFVAGMALQMLVSGLASARAAPRDEPSGTVAVMPDDIAEDVSALLSQSSEFASIIAGYNGSVSITPSGYEGWSIVSDMTDS
jgi:hypothetical protein